MKWAKISSFRSIETGCIRQNPERTDYPVCADLICSTAESDRSKRLILINIQRHAGLFQRTFDANARAGACNLFLRNYLGYVSVRQLGAITRTCNEPATASPVRGLFQYV